MPALKLGEIISNFDAETTRGKINFYTWQQDQWVILFSHPKDFTPVCTSELSRIADQQLYFQKRNVKFLAHSCDSLQEHLAWEKDIVHYNWDMPTNELPYPIIADEDRSIAHLLDMFDTYNTKDLCSTTRTLYIIDPQHKLRFALHYPASTGRCVRELLRIIDSLQLTDRVPQVETPVNWVPGDKVLIKTNVSEGEIKRTFPEGTTIEYVMKKGTIRTTKNYDLL